MIKYALYDKNGNIKQTGETPFKDMYFPAHLTLYIGEVNPDTHRIIDGVPVQKPDEELDRIRRETALREMRSMRNSLLDSTDWTQLPDNALTEQKRNEWAVYRQALRDITEGDPEIPQWPQPPE
jgi:hypothetical protein